MKVNTEFKEVKDIGKIPVDWEVKLLKEIAKICYGKDQKLVEIKDGKYDILGTGGVIGKSDEFLYDKPSVLIGRKGTINNPMYIDKPFWTVDTLFYTEIGELYEPKWFYYSIKHINLERYNEATGVPSLNTSNLNGIKFAVPSKKEQEKIAQILSNVDMNIEKTEQAIAKYKQVKKGLMDDLLTGKVRIKDGKRFRETKFKYVKGVGKIPWDWEVKEIDYYIKSCKSGLSRQIKSEDIGIPVIISGNIQDGKLDINQLKYWYRIDPQGADVDNYILKENDILLCFINSLQQIGKVCLYKDIGREAIYTTNLFKIQSNENAVPEILYYLLSGGCVQNEIKNITKPAVNQASFTKADFLNIKVPCIPKAEQVYISTVLIKQDEIIEKEENYLEKLKKLKLGLMEDLLTGKVRVNIN